MKIKDLFKMNFEEEIEAVVKIGEYSENKANSEIKNYIVTEQIADRIDKFIDYYKENRSDTGIWLSGFYGSGKSYLAKIIGYLLSNPALMGIEARELFNSRLAGLEGRALLENKIEGLSKYKTKTILFDISGESLTGTFYKKLLLNFLKSIGLPKNHIGYIEYQLMKTNRYDEFLQIANNLSQEKIETNWANARTNKMYAPQIIEEAWSKINNDEDVVSTIDSIHDLIEQIDADLLIEELDAFLKMNNDFDRIMFIIDEVSEALDKDHIELSELRGTAQHLSQDSESRFWFIATAQEKLDNVLSKKNINQNDLNIITDRFQHKIHLSSAQVDKVIKERVLAKTDEGRKELKKYFQANEGSINSIAQLSGKFSTTVESEDNFIDYYPFFNYQMRLLKNFLYSVFQQAQSGGSERGMLVTVDRLLKNEDIFQEEIGKFVTGYQLCDYGFPMPQSELEEKFNQAESDLMDEGQIVNGSKLLKTILFLEKSQDLKRTTDNITKLYTDELKYIGDIKDDFVDALELLSDKNYLLKENHEYKITSDVEENMMEEMNLIDVNWENRIDIVREKIAQLPFITKFSTNRLDNKTYNIAIRDENKNLLSSKNGEIQLTIYNILNLDEDIERALDSFKNDYIELNESLLVPDPKSKDKIDKLAKNIYKYDQMISRYRGTTDKEKEKVINSFRTIKSTMESDLELSIDESYHNSWLIYDFFEQKLNKDNLNSEIDKVQSQMINKTYSKRLKETLNQSNAEKFLDVDSKKLVKYCTSGQFNFFDSDGSFIGQELRVVKEIDNECRSKDGRTGSGLVDKFKSKPYGWETEDIMGTLAALMRAGNLKVKYEGSDYRIYSDAKVHKVFTNINEFRNAKFYTVIDGGLSPSKKNRVVDILHEIKGNSNIEVDYNQNDYQVINNIQIVSNYYFTNFSSLKKRLEKKLVEEDRSDVNLLKEYALRNVLDSNLESIANEFINDSKSIKEAIKYIGKLEDFTNNYYLEYQNIKEFIDDINQQIQNESNDDLIDEIEELINEFKTIEKKGVIENYDNLKLKFNDCRQKFNEIFKNYFDELKKKSKEIVEKSANKQQEISEVSPMANKIFYKKLEKYIESYKNFIDKEFILSETHAKEISTNSTLTETKKSIELIGYIIKEIEEYVPEKDRVDPEMNSEPKVYEFTLKSETNNVDYIKRKLQNVLKDLDNDNYDEIKIKITH